MEDQPKQQRYSIHIRGVLGDRLLSAFPELTATVSAHETVLTGPLPDQAALNGALRMIESLGLELLEVRRVPAPMVADPDTDETVAGARPGSGSSPRTAAAR
ncbi:MAG TPA: hypothetical protein VEY67_11070 [Candidatus Dormibacteraeota bacterium]|nr:hypothetical protein [Candidatus Dormibacteraeota bacterium]